MKKIILMSLLVTATTCSFAQYDTLSSKPKDGIQKTQRDSIVYPEKTCVTMHNHQVMAFKHGKLMPLEEAMLLQNGTIVMLNGMVKTVEGRVTQMNEGECLDMNGDMIPIEPFQIKNSPSNSPPKK